MTVPESLNALFFSEDAQSSQAGNALTLAYPVPSSHACLCCFLPFCWYTEMLKSFLFLSEGPEASLCSFVPSLASLLFPRLLYFLVCSSPVTGNIQSKLALTGVVCTGTKIKKHPSSLHIPVCDLDNSLLSLPVPNWKWSNDLSCID